MKDVVANIFIYSFLSVKQSYVKYVYKLQVHINRGSNLVGLETIWVLDSKQKCRNKKQGHEVLCAFNGLR